MAIQRNNFIGPNLGNIASDVTQVVIIFRGTQLIAGCSQNIHQITGNFAVHGHTAGDIFNHRNGRKLQCFKGRYFMGFAITSWQISIDIHAIFAGKQRYLIGHTNVSQGPAGTHQLRRFEFAIRI